MKKLLLLMIMVISASLPAFAQAPPDLYTQGDTFDLTSHIVSTSVFCWYTSAGGQVTGPWLPLEGRSNWTGEPDWWKSQVKQIMAANIDLMNVHHFLQNSGWAEQQRINLFQALAELRADGYDVPKVLPFLDLKTSYDSSVIFDLATAAGKDGLVDMYINFFEAYYSVNTDSYADSYIAQIDGRVALDTWHLRDIGNGTAYCTNIGSLTRNDVETRLSSALGSEHPIFNNGIYMIVLGVNGPMPSFADEKISQFEHTLDFLKVNYNGIQTTQVKAGYWDQNVRSPGSFMTRNSGVVYTGAWNKVAADSSLDRVYIESWNEYDEGSGIYATDTTNPPYTCCGNTNTDTWSDTDDPYEYIKTTYEGASQFNDIPDYDSRILWHNIPDKMFAGEVYTVTVIVRNEGDLMWSAANDFKFGQQEFLPNEVIFGSNRHLATVHK